MLRPFAHPVACCWMLLRVVAQSLKPVKRFSQQLQTFLLFRDRRSIAQQCWIRLHSSSNIVGATHAYYAWCTKTYGLYPSQNALQVPTLLGVVVSVCTPLPRRTQQLPTLLAQQCWELLRPFARCLKVNQISRFMQDSFSMNRNLYFYSSYREICNFSQRCGLGWEQEQEKKMQIKIKFFIRYLWLLSLSTILTLWLFYMRWTHVRHMNATKLRWAKPYTYLNFQFPLLYALYDW